MLQQFVNLRGHASGPCPKGTSVCLPLRGCGLAEEGRSKVGRQEVARDHKLLAMKCHGLRIEAREGVCLLGPPHQTWPCACRIQLSSVVYGG